MARENDLRTIRSLYDIDTDEGRRILCEVIEAYGLDHLSDVVVADLAQRQLEAHDRNIAAKIRSA